MSSNLRFISRFKHVLTEKPPTMSETPLEREIRLIKKMGDAHRFPSSEAAVHGLAYAWGNAGNNQPAALNKGVVVSSSPSSAINRAGRFYAVYEITGDIVVDWTYKKSHPSDGTIVRAGKLGESVFYSRIN